VAVWREFIFWVQVHVLFEGILRGEATRLKEHLARKDENIFRCNKCPLNMRNYFLRELRAEECQIRLIIRLIRPNFIVLKFFCFFRTAFRLIFPIFNIFFEFFKIR
jgi:hypothetical protein